MSLLWHAHVPYRYNKSPAQVSLRFLLDKGIAVIPSAHTADYMIENLAVHTTTVRVQSDEKLPLHGAFACHWLLT